MGTIQQSATIVIASESTFTRSKLHYWSKELGVTPQKLKEAVDEVGVHGRGRAKGACRARAL
jgi:hypothetical protein